MLNFFQPQAHVSGLLIIDGREYPISYFYVGFGQGIDYKGQPQEDVRGGQIKVALKQSVDRGIYEWAKSSGSLKNGAIKFVSETEGTKLNIEFTKAFCISMVRDIDAYKGTSTVLVIAPEKVKINNKEHNNYWRS